MPSISKYYPPSPAGVPEDLTEPLPAYRHQVNMVIASLIVFFLLYVGVFLILVILTVCLLTMRTSSPTGFVVRGILVVFLGITCVLMIANLFRKRRWGRNYDVEIHEDEFPRFFEFLECVCDETGAPFPDRVFVNFEVNASAGSEVSLVSLVRPPRCQLIVGLGLMNLLNLTEFKGLLAHELGHFSQFHMKSGPGIRLAMQVVGNIVTGHEWLQFKAREVSVLHFLFIGNALLEALFRAVFPIILRAHFRLSHEMEYHADLVAVGAVGSDAVASLLYKSYWAEACLHRTVQDLAIAKEHDLHSSDVFLHQKLAGKFLRKRLRDPYCGEPPALPDNPKLTVQVFEPADDDLEARMWMHHPSNYNREMNCKAFYIRTEYDPRSPWILFGDADELRERVSRRFYKHYLQLTNEDDLSDPRDVQRFLDEENASLLYDPKYGGLYDFRNLKEIDLDAICAAAEKGLNDPADLIRHHLRMYPQAVADFAIVYHRHQEEYGLLRSIVNRWHEPRNNRFEFRGEPFPSRAARRLLDEVKDDLDNDDEWLEEFDRNVFVAYYELAIHVDSASAVELRRRYRFHHNLQTMWIVLKEREPLLEYLLSLLNSGGRPSERRFQTLVAGFRELHSVLKAILADAEVLVFPQLRNMPANEHVRPYLLKKRLVDNLTHDDWVIRMSWMRAMIDQYQQVARRLDRFHFKSLKAILDLQDSIGERAVAKVGGK